MGSGGVSVWRGWRESKCVDVEWGVEVEWVGVWRGSGCVEGQWVCGGRGLEEILTHKFPLHDYEGKHFTIHS